MPSGKTVLEQVLVTALVVIAVRLSYSMMPSLASFLAPSVSTSSGA